MPIVVPPLSPVNYGLSHQEMIDQVSDELRNIKIASKITRWLNMSVVEIAAMYLFSHLNAYGNEITSPGNPDIELNDDFHWLKSVQIPANNRKLYSYDENKLSETYPSYRTLQGTVTHYYLNGRALGLWAVPSGAGTIEYGYQRRPIKLVALTDICDLPVEWHSLVTQKATTKGYDYEGNGEASIRSKTEESRLLVRLGVSVFKRPDDTVIMGSERRNNRVSHPRLPSNYPVR